MTRWSTVLSWLIDPVATQIRENSGKIDLNVNDSTISIDVSKVQSRVTVLISFLISL